MRIASVCGCLLLVPITVSAQPRMSKAEAAQLFTAAKFGGRHPKRGRSQWRWPAGGYRSRRRNLLLRHAGEGFWLVSKVTNGGWRLITGGPGIPEFLKTKGVGGWPDLLVGGPGFCFPVERWNGKE